MDFGERLKKLRKALGLTQQQFADRLDIKRGTIANYEIGRNEPINSVVNLICREFRANETWLRTGEGEMFLPETDDVFDEIIRKYHLDKQSRNLLISFCKLPPEGRQAVIRFVKTAAENLEYMSSETAVLAAYDDMIKDDDA